MKKTRHGDYEKTIRFPVFSNYQVKVVFTDDVAASKKARYGTDFDTSNASAVHCHDETQGVSHIIFDINRACNGTMAHESWHAIYAMMKWAGAGLENEVVAYHLGYLTQRVNDFFFYHIPTKRKRAK